jgi:hypothetical protein
MGLCSATHVEGRRRHFAHAVDVAVCGFAATIKQAFEEVVLHTEGRAKSEIASLSIQA